MKRSMLAAAIALCGLLVGFATTPANAAANPASVVSGTGNAADNPCVPHLSGPQKSSGVPPTVSVAAVVVCSTMASSITLNITIVHNNRPYSFFSSATRNTTVLAGIATAPCLGGTIVGTASFQIVFPAGTVPRGVNLDLASLPASITC